MSELCCIEATVFFGLPADGGDFFTLDDPVKGLLDNTTYLLAGDVGTNLHLDAVSLSVRRGRERQVDEFDPGEAIVVLQNTDRDYDDTHTSSPYFGAVRPGKRVEIKLWGQTVFAGSIDDWNQRWSQDGYAEAEFVALDALGSLARMRFDAWTTTAGQTAGPRLSAALSRGEVNFGINRDFDTGVSTLQDDSVTWDSNVLNYCQLVARSDAGRFFATRTNALRFQDRHALINPTPTVTFADDGTGIEFAGITTQSGSELLYNRVGVDREGGLLQTVDDDASMAAYEVRTLNLTGLLMNSDSQSRDMAEWLLNTYKDPAQRVESIDILVNALDPADRGTVCRLDIGDVARVRWTPARTGNQLDDNYIVEQVQHDVAEGRHLMRVSFSPVTQSSVFILDDPVYGLLNGPGRLAF